MSYTELRCDSEHRHLLGKIWGRDSRVKVELVCHRCKQDLRRDNPDIKLVVFTFAADGSVTASKVVTS